LGSNLAEEKGTDLIEKFLIKYPTLPIVFLADQKSPELVSEAFRAGISAYLEPPLKTDEIIDAVQSSLKRAGRMGDWVRQKVKGTTASLEKRVSELEILLAVGRDITGTLELDEVLKNVVSKAVKLTHAEEGSLLLLDEETNELYMRASHNFEEGFAESFRVPVNDTLAGQVIASGEPLVISKDDLEKIKTAYLVHSLIYVPLKFNEKIIGVLGVDNRQHRLPFTDRDLLLISLLADYAAIAIENARLYQTSENERSKFEAVLANMGDALMILDKEKRVQLVNITMCSALDISEEKLLNKKVDEVVSQNDFLTLLSFDEEKTVQHHEIILNDGHTFSAQHTQIPNVGAVITMQNISHLKELNNLKDNFVHTVSHDLRSPLTAVLGYAELLERVGTINEQQKEFIRRIQASVQDITALINDLLDLGKIEAGIDANNETIQLGNILRYTVDNIKLFAEKKKQKLDINIATELPPIRGNPTRLRQIFDNLISNAIKYTPEGKKVYIELKHEDKQIIFIVTDQGPGIPQEDQPYIFEKFYRASNISSSASGTGLGLAIVKTIVDSHNGRIWVESKVNEGTTFFVVLPS
ncbi:MAG TPA: GAF domain-containing protein, partial [Anaerolineales bacterium]|nr:GAF domain-containing protein [Anaerolineales bacterium]